MVDSKRKFWKVGQIDATGVKGPHEKELEDISKSKYSLFIDINMDTLKSIVEENLGGIIENIGFNEDWTITIEMFPEVNIHMAYTFYGDEFGDETEAEFIFYFSGEHITWVPGEDSATYIDILMDFIQRLLKSKEPFEKDYSHKTELMEKVLVQRSEPFKRLKEEDRNELAEFIGAKAWKTSDGWRIKKEFFPEMFFELKWNEKSGLDCSFSGGKLINMSSYHAELIGIFMINHVLRYITIHNEDENLHDICYMMFSRMFTKGKGWEHRTR